MVSCIKIVAKTVLGESRNDGLPIKNKSWWNKEIKTIFKIKWDFYRGLKNSDGVNLGDIRYFRRRLIKLFRMQELKSTKKKCEKLNTQETENDIYKIAQIGKVKYRDLYIVKCLK